MSLNVSRGQSRQSTKQAVMNCAEKWGWLRKLQKTAVRRLGFWIHLKQINTFGDGFLTKMQREDLFWKGEGRQCTYTSVGRLDVLLIVNLWCVSCCMQGGKYLAKMVCPLE